MYRLMSGSKTHLIFILTICDKNYKIILTSSGWYKKSWVVSSVPWGVTTVERLSERSGLS